MFSLKKIFTVFFLLILITSNGVANDKVAYLDIDFILTNSKEGKLVLENLKKIENKKIEEFKEKEKNLKKEENQILASKSIISEDALNKKISEFQNKLKLYKDYKSKEINNIKNKRDKDILNLINKINPIVENFMKENSISIIIDKKNIFIANKNYDITNDIIKEINNNFN